MLGEESRSGKRFRRTTSMSHLGPACHHSPAAAAATSEDIQAMRAFNIVSSVPPKAARQLISQEEEQYRIIQGHAGGYTREADANMGDVMARQLIFQEEEQYQIVEGRGGGASNAHEGDANMGDMCAGFDFSEKGSQHEGGEEHMNVLYDGGDACRENMVPGFDFRQEMADTIFTAHGESPPLQVLPPPSLVPFQMGLWTHNNFGFGSHLGHSSSFGKLGDSAAFISPVDFLDVCFCCKRRLRPERDIFIYRGDTAFCSEECRHRQILSDERRSLRAASNSGKRGARATSSETAVAA
eukprot:c7770_g1_i1 orf=82-972(+)